jgi:tetratricopeptide (TPR) repeat protein
LRACLLVVLLAGLSACGLMGRRGSAPVAAGPQTAAVAPGEDAAADSLLPEIPAAAATAWARAEAAVEAEDWAAARRALEQLVSEYPLFAGPLVNLAILDRRDGRDDEAEALLDTALKLEPNHAAANNELGMLLRERGEFDAAEAAYRRALTGDPDYRYAHLNLGVLLDLYLGRPDEAIVQYEAYQALLEEPDPEVDLWIADLSRRVGADAEPIRVAQEAGG